MCRTLSIQIALICFKLDKEERIHEKSLSTLNYLEFKATLAAVRVKRLRPAGNGFKHTT